MSLPGPIRVAVFGAGGRMGATTCAAVLQAPDLELVAAVDPSFDGRLLSEVVSGVDAGSRRIAGDVGSLEGTPVDVAVDFTVAASARQNLAWCAEHGVHAVVGTTGFSAEDYARFAELFGAASNGSGASNGSNGSSGRGANAVIAANFSIGAALMMACAALCAPHFDGVEIIELHHNRKRDAPSGTALATVGRIEAARRAAGSGPLSPDPTETQSLPGTRGGTDDEGVHVHSVRLPGFVAHQEVIFGSLGETLTIRHDSTDRVSFMPGVLLAVRSVADRPGLTIGLEALLPGLT